MAVDEVSRFDTGDITGALGTLRRGVFYALYALLVGLAAIVTVAWGNDLGVVIDGVEALNGILLPSALMFLVLLCNDKAVLGPWANGTVHNWICGVVVWAVLTFSLAPVVTTFFPNVSLAQCEYAFAACAALGLAAAAILAQARKPRNAVGPGRDRAGKRAALREQRAAWRTPPLDTLPRPELSTGLLVLRGYIVFAAVIMVLKLIQVASGH